MKPKLLIVFVLISALVFGRTIETFYGMVDVQEQVLLDLIDSAAFQRLKYVNQYGVSRYTSHKEEFTRYAHSLGVFHLLRANGRSLQEQIAGLLHDVSHTAFSHVGDWVFHKEYHEVDYQNSVHEEFLEKQGLSPILMKYGIDPKSVLPTAKNAPALEAPRPDASADRLDYSIQGATHQNFITKEEAIKLFQDCKYIDDKWIATNRELMAKVVKFILFMTEDCFSSPQNHLASRWLADAIIKALELKLILPEEFHFGTDDALWAKLSSSTDPFIQTRMDMILHTESLFSLVNQKDADFHLVTKFWGFDPWIHQDGKLTRLTTIDPEIAKEYQAVKDRIKGGYDIKLVTRENALSNSSYSKGVQ